MLSEEVASHNTQSPVRYTGLDPIRTKVIARQRNALLCLSLHSVRGCVRVDKLARLPGSQERIKGILLFRGKPVPLVSLQGWCSDRPSHKQHHEDFALVLSACGKEFALRVDDVPKMVEGPLLCGPEMGKMGKVCIIHIRHVERLIETCVFPHRKTAQSPRVPACDRAG
jgi:hypothetical protein